MTRKMIVLGFLGALIVLGFLMFSNRKQMLKARPADAIVATPSADYSASPTPAPNLPKSALKLAPADLRKIVVLQSVMEAKNEHDPHLERDLSNLSPAVKSVMDAIYAETPLEKTHERGMIVLVMGRKITQKSDIDFLKGVLMEKPLIGTNGKPLPGVSENDANYPQMIAIRVLVEQDRLLRGDPGADKTLAPHILETLKSAMHSPNAKVASDAGAALFYLTGKK